MNVIFLDFDGVINTFNSVLEPFEDKNAVEKRIKILGDICKEYNCKIVIESSHKTCIDEETLETNPNESGLLESHKKEVGKILKKEYKNKRKS